MAGRAEPAAAVEDTKPWLTIGQRLSAIRAECFGIGKQAIQMESAKGGKYTIQAHTVEAILAETRPLLEKHGVDLTPNLVSREYSGNRCDVIVEFTFEVLDNDGVGQTESFRRVVRWAGAGTDNGDKAFAKAGTNALKEMLKKVFLITDREDAKEEAESIRHETPESVSRHEMARVSEQRRAAIEQWAKAFKMAIEKADSPKDITRLQTENRDQLMSEDLPEVTRVFFIELMQTRKADLEK